MMKTWMTGMVSFFCVGQIFAANSDSITATFDFRDYTLSVASDHGTPVPSLGTHSNYCWQSSVTCSVDSAVSEGGTKYTSIGWTGIGSVPTSGTTNTTDEIILSDLDSSIVWNWNTNYWLEAVVRGEGQVLGGNAWMPAGTNAPLAAMPESGWLFMGWSGDLVADYTQSNATLLVDAPKSVTATFSDDADGDGLLNTNETAIGTNPRNRDTDGDGIDDAFEVGQGLSPTNSNTALLDYILADKETFGYYTEEELGALAIGNLMIGTTNGTANLWLQLWKSDDLNSWTNAGDAVLWQMPAGEGKQFYKVQAGE